MTGRQNGVADAAVGFGVLQQIITLEEAKSSSNNVSDFKKLIQVYMGILLTVL